MKSLHVKHLIMIRVSLRKFLSKTETDCMLNDAMTLRYS